MFAQTVRGCSREDNVNSCSSIIFSCVKNNNIDELVPGIYNETKERLNVLDINSMDTIVDNS